MAAWVYHPPWSGLALGGGSIGLLHIHSLSPNRPPSKSSILDTSIAYIRASHRHNSLAARELRTLKAELDALCHEVNVWRDHANLPRVEQPVRGHGFFLVLNDEFEKLDLPSEETQNYLGFDELNRSVRPHFTFQAGDIDVPRTSIAQDLTTLNTDTFQVRCPVFFDAGPTQVCQPSAPPPTITNPGPHMVSRTNPTMALLCEPYGTSNFITHQTLDSSKIFAWGAQLHTQRQRPQAIYPRYDRFPRNVTDAASFLDTFGDYQQ
jgi:hypothetical protein